MKSGTFLAALLATACGLRAADLSLAVDTAQSHIEVVVKATMDSFTGELQAYQAAITINSERSEITQAKFSFHFADVKTGNSGRDETMHEWQETPTYPDGEFTLVAFERDPAGAALRARGTLIFHGRAKEIVFPVSVAHDGDKYAIDGDATLDTREFGLPIIRKFKILKVDPEVHVRFHLQGTTAEHTSDSARLETHN